MSRIIIISIPPEQNLADDIATSGTSIEKHLMLMLDQLMLCRDNGYSIEVKESDG